VGEAVWDGGWVFRREWSGVSVSIDVLDETATLAWK
jgi:hypothetical protein